MTESIKKFQMHLLAVLNPLGTMSIYICMRVPTAHRDEHIYMRTVHRVLYTAYTTMSPHLPTRLLPFFTQARTY